MNIKVKSGPVLSAILIAILTVSCLTYFKASVASAACPVCGSTITTNTTLDADMSCSGTGIIIGANNIVLDCAGHSITGPGSGWPNGIYLSGRTGVTVKNCVVTKFSGVGIRLESSPNNTLINNNILNNGYGIYLDSMPDYNIDSSSNYNIISNNTVNSNSSGIFLEFNSNNTLTNNTVSNNNGYGIVLGMSSNNTLTNNTVSNNSFQGIGLWSGSNNNKLTGNTASSNGGGGWACEYGCSGIALVCDANNNILTNNNASNNYANGISLVYRSNNNKLTSNTANNNVNGLYLDYSSNYNYFDSNDFSSNSANNVVYTIGAIGNAFVNNTGYEPTDSDGDSFPDIGDSCPAVYGKAFSGCPYASLTNVKVHYIDQANRGICPDGKTSCTLPGTYSWVKVFDRNNPDFQAQWGKNPKGSLYPDVFWADAGVIGNCWTDSNGSCMIAENKTGDYLVLAYFTDPQWWSWSGIMGLPVSSSDYNKDGLATKELSIIIMTNKDGSTKSIPASKKTLYLYGGGGGSLVPKKTLYASAYASDALSGSETLSGSTLDIVYPEFMDWGNDTSVTYPLVLTSDSDWTTDVCLNAPAGYKLAGDSCQQAFVNGETKTLLFQAVDIGSPKPDMKMKIKATHQGKVQNLDLDIPGQRDKDKTKDQLDQEKALKVKMDQKKVEMQQKIKDLQDQDLKVKIDQKKVEEMQQKFKEIYKIKIKS